MFELRPLLCALALCLVLPALPSSAQPAGEAESAESSKKRSKKEAAAEPESILDEVLESGMISVNSEPSSYVYLDGAYLGTTPVLNHGVVAGEHVLTLKCIACDADDPKATWRKTITIVDDQLFQHVQIFDEPPPSPELKKEEKPAPTEDTPATLFVSAEPYANVYVDGRLAGTTPLVNVPLSPGMHTILLVCGGCSKQVKHSETLRVGAGEDHFIEHTFSSP